MSIELRIKELIQKNNLTQGAFSESIDMDASRFGRALNGKEGFTLKQLIDISSIYQKSLDWLVLGEDTKKPDTNPALDINSDSQDHPLEPVLLRIAAALEALAYPEGQTGNKTIPRPAGTKGKQSLKEIGKNIERVYNKGDKDRSGKESSGKA